MATDGTAKALSAAGIACRRVNKVREGRPHIVDMIKNDEINLIVNTTEGKQAIRESRSIRREAVHRKVTYYTTHCSGARHLRCARSSERGGRQPPAGSAPGAAWRETRTDHLARR